VGRGDAEEFDVGDFESEALVAFAADVGRGFTSDGDDSGSWIWSGAVGAGGDERAWEHVDNTAAFKI